MPNRIDITPEIELAVRRYEIALVRFVPGRDSTSDVERPLGAIGVAVAQALGLPSLQELFTGAAVPRYKPRPVKVHTTQRQSRRRLAR